MRTRPIQSFTHRPRERWTFALIVHMALPAPCSSTPQSAAPGWSIRVHATELSDFGGVEALAIRGTDMFGRSLEFPAGHNVQLAVADQSGNVAKLVTFPAPFRNSGDCGIAVDPLGDAIVLADENANRIVSFDLVANQLVTVLVVPWNMNPFGNGTGQQQYATNPNDPNLLYFWDSTRARLYSFDRATGNAPIELLALDQGAPDGMHFSTVLNDIAYDAATNCVLISDGSTDSVLEVDLGGAPDVTTLFANVPGTPRSIAFDPSTQEVFVRIGNTILVGARTGGALLPLACDFDQLRDVIVGTATSGSGTSLFVASRTTDTVFEVFRDRQSTMTTYCTAKLNSCSTGPAISAAGCPSASASSGFSVLLYNARAEQPGLLLYSDAGRLAIPFQGGTLCVSTMPLKRTVVVNDNAGTPGECDGALSLDMNCFASGNCGGSPLPSLLTPGTQVNCQWWARDTVSNGSLLSDALEYEIGL